MKTRSFLLARPLIVAIVFWFVGIVVFPAMAVAGMSISKGSDLLQHFSDSTREDNVNKIKVALEKKLVVQKLTDFGLSSDEVISKISQMSDEQIHQMSSFSDKILAGGSDFGIAITVLLLIILVIVVIKLLGHDVIVK